MWSHFVFDRKIPGELKHKDLEQILKESFPEADYIGGGYAYTSFKEAELIVRYNFWGTTDNYAPFEVAKSALQAEFGKWFTIVDHLSR